MKQILALLLCFFLGYVFSADNGLPGDASVRHNPIETHHSLYHPFDTQILYWKQGGSTVMTHNLIRLTPMTQDRRGWLWNDYSLESKDWEVAVRFKVSSRPNFGGDGFAFWILDESFDPMYHADPHYLSGPVYGLRSDFKGFGVVFDTYDNDNRRDNPSIFVVQNKDANIQMDHDADWKNVMVKSSPEGIDYKCSFDYRNSLEPVKAVFRFKSGSIHVYLDSGVGFKHCLTVAVPLDDSREYHIAFSGMTGQLADAHDLLEISTRYLDASDAEIDDSKMDHADSPAFGSRVHWLYWLLLVLGGSGLAFFTAYEIYIYLQMQKQHMNQVVFCDNLNKLIVPHYNAYFALVAFLVIGLQFRLLLVNLPLVAWRALALSQKTHLMDAAQLAGEEVKTGGLLGKLKMRYLARRAATLIMYVALTAYFFYRLSNV